MKVGTRLLLVATVAVTVASGSAREARADEAPGVVRVEVRTRSDSPLDFSFLRSFSALDDAPPAERTETAKGLVLDESGTILTVTGELAPAHATVTVALADGTRLDASLRGRDPTTGLAVAVLANPPRGLRRARLADAVVDERGRVLELRARPARSGFWTLVAPFLATRTLPADLVADIARQLAERGRVEKGWLGARLEPATWPFLSLLGGAVPATFVRVTEVTAGGPAAKAGLQAGDLVMAAGERGPATLEAIERKLGALGPGGRLRLAVLRKDGVHLLGVELGTRPRAAVLDATLLERAE